MHPGDPAVVGSRGESAATSDSGTAGKASEQLDSRLSIVFVPSYLDGVHDDLKTLDSKASPLPQTVAVQVPRNTHCRDVYFLYLFSK